MSPRCQLLPSCTTLPRHVDKLEADAASGLSAHNRLQTCANVLPAACAVSNSAMVKRVCNNGLTVTLNVPTFMLSVSNGGVAHDHGLHPKQPADQDAVDPSHVSATASLRLPQTRRSLLPITGNLGSSLRSLFGREEALCPLRFVEEILNSQWFDTVTWDSIKDLRGTTYVQPPPRFRFALQQAQQTVLCTFSRPVLVRRLACSGGHGSC